MSQQDSSTAALLLVNRLTDVGGVKPLTAREYWDLLKVVPDPATMLGLSVDDLQSRGLEADLANRAVRLLDASIPFAFERERLESGGIQVVSTFDRSYPSRLRSRLADACPAFLLIAGSAGGADAGGLGIVGSRDVSEAGTGVAEEAAAAAAYRGEVVVSGLARGVDEVAMAAALGRGGLVTGIPSEGLNRVSRNAEIRRHVLDERLCLVSPYGPNSPFSAANAMGRNKLIYALADRTFVVASDRETGGTWAGATEAIRRAFGTVAVWLGEGAGPGNTALAGKGASPIRSLAELANPLEPTGQLSLAAVADTPIARGTLPSDVVDVPEREPEIFESRRTTSSGDSQDGGAPSPQGSPDSEEPSVSEEDLSPTGWCWCGCGTEVAEGQYFAPRHDSKAATNTAVALFGSVEGFLAAHGYRDSNPPPVRKRRK